MTAKLLMYGLTDDENYLVDFTFDINSVQGYYIDKELDYLSVIISGQVYELEYNKELHQEIEASLKVRKLFLI